MRLVRKILRWAVFAMAVAGTATVVLLGLIAALDDAKRPYTGVRLDALKNIENVFDRNKQIRSGSEYTVSFLGDSLSQGIIPSSLMWVPRQLRAYLRKNAGWRTKIELLSTVHSGLSVYSYYFLIDKIMTQNPDLVVIEFNLFYLSDFWHGRDRTDFATWMPIERWPKAMGLPLEAVGISVDEMIFGRSLVSAGLFSRWHWLQREQARLVSAYKLLANTTQLAATGKGTLDFRVANVLKARAETRVADTNRATPKSVDRLLGDALRGASPDDPALVMLDALLADFRDAGVEVLLFVPPHNIEHVASLKMLDAEGLAQTIRVIEFIAEQNDATFVDLHSLLGDEYFRDSMDHLSEDEEHQGSPAVARELGEAVVEIYEGRDSR
jgi:hypothetical protein